jgi:hypothetical protein
MDAPLWRHYRKLGVWLVLQGLLSALCGIVSVDMQRLRQEVDRAGDACVDATFSCGNASASRSRRLLRRLQELPGGPLHSTGTSP